MQYTEARDADNGEVIHTCDYCTSRMYREALTPEARIAYRVERFIEELRKNPTAMYTRSSVADALEGIIECELGAQETETDFREDVDELKQESMLEREAR